MEVGQIVYMKPVGNNRNMKIQEGTIIKVGRKYCDVQDNRSDGYKLVTKFHMDTLENVTDYSAGWVLYFSLQQIKDEEEQHKIAKELRDIFNAYGKLNLSLDQLKRIKEICAEVKNP